MILKPLQARISTPGSRLGGPNPALVCARPHWCSGLSLGLFAERERPRVYPAAGYPSGFGDGGNSIA